MDHFNQYNQFADLPGITDDYGHYEKSWASNSPYNQWNTPLSFRSSDIYASKLQLQYAPAHDVTRFERFLVEPHPSPYSAALPCESFERRNVTNSLNLYAPYHTFFPDTLPRQGSPAETHSSQRSISHSDDASTDCAAQCSISSVSVHSPSQPAYVDYHGFPADGTHGGGIALSEIQPYPDESTIDSEPYASAEEVEQSVNAYNQERLRCKLKLELPIPPGNGARFKEDPSAYDRTDSEEPVKEEDDDYSDGDYNPNRRSPRTKRPKRRSSQSSTVLAGKATMKRQSHSRKTSLCSANNDRVQKSRGHKSRSSISETAVRPFPCPFARYGCDSTFTSKNEWKRHVGTQHVKLGFWRCDMCAPSPNTSEPFNDFNRKDLFTQHLRRMHADVAADGTVKAPPLSPVKRGPALANAIPEDVVSEHQHRCYVRVRSPPPKSNCLVCNQSFAGAGSWADRMDHLGNHFERDRRHSAGGSKATDVAVWKEDTALHDWLRDEGLIDLTAKGVWKIGDGVPLRDRVDGQ